MSKLDLNALNELPKVDRILALAETNAQLEKLDAAYRALVAVLYNFVPTSGHPGGSISSGRIVESLLYKIMAYELAAPRRKDADILSYAAGHKALGLYGLWALRNECVRIAQPALLAEQEKDFGRPSGAAGAFCVDVHRSQRRGGRFRRRAGYSRRRYIRGKLPRG